MSNLLSGRKKLNKLTEERFENPRPDEFEISAGTVKENEDAIVLADKRKNGRNRKFLFGAEDKSVPRYNKVTGRFSMDVVGEKPEFIYFIEFNFHNIIITEINKIRKLISEVGFFDFIDDHYIYVGDGHSSGQKITVKKYNIETPEQSIVIAETITESKNSEFVYDLESKQVDGDNNTVTNYRLQPKDIITVEVDPNFTNTPAEPIDYVQVVLKMRINSEELTSPWARAVFNDFESKKYSQLMSPVAKGQVLDFLKKQTTYNKFGPGENSLKFTDSSFMFAYEFEFYYNNDKHFKIKTTYQSELRDWNVLNGNSFFGITNVPDIEDTGNSTVVIITQDDGNIQDSLEHMNHSNENNFIGIMPKIWAGKVVKHFNSTNIQRSSNNRLSEWRDWSKNKTLECAKNSELSEELIPWRFFGEKTELMVDKEDWINDNNWGSVSSKLSEYGYLQSDLDDNVGNPRRMWGINTQELDKIYHRLIGSDKYTSYYQQYDSYQFDYSNEYFIPDGNITETEKTIREYYWKEYGLFEGIGSIASDWLYPIFYLTVNLNNNSSIYKFINIYNNNTIFKDQIFINNDINLRRDAQGQIINLGQNNSVLPNENKISNIGNNVNNVKYDTFNLGKHDNLLIMSPETPNELQYYSIDADGGPPNDFRMNNGVEDWYWKKKYSKIGQKIGLSLFYPLPVFLGIFNFKIGIAFETNWFLEQENILLENANLIFHNRPPCRPILNNLSNVVGFKNITTKIDSFGNSTNSSVNLTAWEDINLNNSPNLEYLKCISNKIRIQNCESLVYIEITRKYYSFSLPLDIEFIDLGNGDYIADKINQKYLDTLILNYCGLETYKIDAIIRSIHKVVITDNTNTNTNGVLDLTGSSDTDLSLIYNSPPSNNQEINGMIQDLSNLGWTIYHVNFN